MAVNPLDIEFCNSVENVSVHMDNPNEETQNSLRRAPDINSFKFNCDALMLHLKKKATGVLLL